MKRETEAEIDSVRDAVAGTVTEGFLAQHPDWVERDGGVVTGRGVPGARHHIDSLYAAVVSNDPTVFRDYVMRSRALLDSQGIDLALLLEGLEAIRDEMATLLSPRAAEAVETAMGLGIEALAAEQASDASDASAAADAPPACLRYLAASVTGSRVEALGIVRESVSGGRMPVDVYVDIFQSALYEVGRRWQSAGLTIAEEHMATATTQYILSVLHEELPRTASRRGTAIVTGVVNERHVVGAHIVANVLDEDGWDVRPLGAGMPHDAIVSAIDQHRATLVAISVTMGGGAAEARELISKIRQSVVPAPRIIVGGAAFLRDSDLWRTVGADGFAADARSVAELAAAADRQVDSSAVPGA